MKCVLPVVPGGGAAARLQPLILARAKPVVALGGKDRLIDRPVSNRIKSGIARIDALTQCNRQSLSHTSA
jgi:ADP-glucose pyrophosphorylase